MQSFLKAEPLLVYRHEPIESLTGEHPMPQAIWLIDRERTYVEMERELRGLQCYRPIPESPSLAGFQRYCGMPLYRWSSGEVRSRIAALLDEGLSMERVRQIFPFCQPGVWVQMSDGKHRRLMQ